MVEVATATAANDQGYVIINGRRVRMISTKNQDSSVKKKKKKSKVEVEEAPKTEPKKVIKTKMHKRELEKYKKLLLIKRAEIAGDLSAMEAEALRSNGGDISHMPIHMADIGSDTYEQDFMLGMAENERQRIREIDEALKRIENRTYGVCQMTGKPIPKARLEAKPWAKYTIEAARQVEGTWGA
ncbi:MAG: TraR/DksA C4-type zinc finger protein [Planctomycetota bacterium]|nr:TraR/DksA C4-type zinc finger protein [Planctomycetota bacterium]